MPDGERDGCHHGYREDGDLDAEPGLGHVGKAPPQPLVEHDHVSGAGREKTYFVHRGRRLFRHRNWPADWEAGYRRDFLAEETASWTRALLCGAVIQARRGRRDADALFGAEPISFSASDGAADASWLAPFSTHRWIHRLGKTS